MVGLLALVGVTSALGCGLDAVGLLEPDVELPIDEGGTSDVAPPLLD